MPACVFLCCSFGVTLTLQQCFLRRFGRLLRFLFFPSSCCPGPMLNSSFCVCNVFGSHPHLKFLRLQEVFLSLVPGGFVPISFKTWFPYFRPSFSVTARPPPLLFLDLRFIFLLRSSPFLDSFPPRCCAASMNERITRVTRRGLFVRMPLRLHCDFGRSGPCFPDFLCWSSGTHRERLTPVSRAIILLPCSSLLKVFFLTIFIFFFKNVVELYQYCWRRVFEYALTYGPLPTSLGSSLFICALPFLSRGFCSHGLWVPLF